MGMVAILVFAAVIAGVLALLLARYAPPIVRARRRQSSAPDPRPPLSANSLYSLTLQLLNALGFSVVEEPGSDGGRSLVASKREPLGEVRYLVVLEPTPPGGVVDQPTVLALAENVKGERAAGGMLITPGEIETVGLSGLDVPLELIDGARLRKLIAKHLPERLGELDHYLGFGPAGVAPEPLPQGPR